MNKVLMFCSIFWLNLAVAETGIFSIEVDPFGKGSSSVPFSGKDTEWTISGHAWVRYVSDDGWEATLGTWGNSTPKGLRVNWELERTARVSRSIRINDSQFETILSKFREYNNDDSWTHWDNCTKFASDIWNTVANENIDNRYPLPEDNIWNATSGRWPTPTSLFYAIIAINNGSSDVLINQGDFSASHIINIFYEKEKNYFGKKIGNNYSCFSSYTCQNFSNGEKIAVSHKDLYIYLYNGFEWVNYGLIDDISPINTTKNHPTVTKLVFDHNNKRVKIKTYYNSNNGSSIDKIYLKIINSSGIIHKYSYDTKNNYKKGTSTITRTYSKYKVFDRTGTYTIEVYVENENGVKSSVYTKTVYLYI